MRQFDVRWWVGDRMERYNSAVAKGTGSPTNPPTAPDWAANRDRPYSFLGTVAAIGLYGCSIVVTPLKGKRRWHHEEFYIEGVTMANPVTGADTQRHARFTVTGIAGHSHGIELSIAPALRTFGTFHTIVAMPVIGARVYDGSLPAGEENRPVEARNTWGGAK